MDDSDVDQTGPSPLAGFLSALSDRGDVIVLPYRDDALDIDAGIARQLSALDQSLRSELPASAPAFEASAAGWAAIQLYRACQFLVCREIDPETVKGLLDQSCPSRETASTVYSVDLVFRFLPNLFDLARRLAPEDTLVAVLRTWAHQWPLSSVGIKLDASFSIESFAKSPALLRLYADRIVQLEATDRLTDSRVRSLIQVDLGLHEEMSPVIARSVRDILPSAPATLNDISHE